MKLFDELLAILCIFFPSRRISLKLFLDGNQLNGRHFYDETLIILRRKGMYLFLTSRPSVQFSGTLTALLFVQRAENKS